MKTPLLNLVINDTHCGSDYGLLPKRVKLEKGRELSCIGDEFLEWLWNAFDDMVRRFNALRCGQPYILTLNGDLIEGIHHKSDEIVAAKFSEHLAIAIAALGPLVRGAEKTFITIGTAAHTQDYEKVFAQELDVKQPVKHVQTYEVNGCLVEATHHMPTTTRKHLEAGPLSVMMSDRIANLVRARHRVPRVFLRGHRHLTGDYCDGETMIICCGPWQGLTRFGHKVVPNAICRPSAFLLDWRNLPFGSLPTRHQFNYTPPEGLQP
jgi:hypothetical protein